MRRLTILLSICVVATAGCRAGTSEAGAATSEESPERKEETTAVEPIPVEVMTVGTETFRESTTVPGTTAPAETVRVSVEQPGRIASTRLEEGRRVERGERLLRLETDLEKARIDRLEHAVEAARREFERTKRLREDELATPQEFDRAETELEDAKLQLKQARVTLRQATVRSPRAGVVTEVFVEEGEYASPGRPVAKISDLSTIEVTAAVPASRIGAIEEEETIEVDIPPLGESFEGTITRRPSTVSSETRTYPVELEIDNSDRRIRPGMRASLTFTRKVWRDAVVIPRTAILQGYTRKEIAVVSDGGGGEGRAEIRAVEVGPGDGNRRLVESGLEPDERLVVRGHRSLMQDAPVKVVQTYETLQKVLDAGL